jgi:hypothetical protein
VLEHDLELSARVDRRGPDVAEFVLLAPSHKKTRGFAAGAVEEGASHPGPRVEHDMRGVCNVGALQVGQLFDEPITI